MPVLATLIATLFGALTDFLVRYFTRTLAIKIALGAMVVTAFGVLFGLMNAAVAALAYAAPPLLVTAFAFVFPSNILQCAAAAISARAVVTGFRIFMITTATF